MAIKRGVSYYSYQQEQYFGRMDYHDMSRELAENLMCDGVEIINESTVPGYPFPTPQFLADWNNTMGRYNLTPVAMDCFLDTLRFRDHVMNLGEAAELTKLDIKLAHDMGFKQIRVLGLPKEVLLRALDTAEKLDVKMALEIHEPIPIKANPKIIGINGESVGTLIQETVDLIKETGTKHIGFIPDMGIFKRGPHLDGVLYMLRHMEDRKLADEITEMMQSVSLGSLAEEIEKRYPGKLTPAQMRMVSWKRTAEPEDLVPILPYISSFHGKVHNMTEIPGQPGQYEEPSMMYKEVIDVLKGNNWNGYINTEFEGQRFDQDRGLDYLADEVEQVRRHHEMLKRLIEM